MNCWALLRQQPLLDSAALHASTACLPSLVRTAEQQLHTGPASSSTAPTDSTRQLHSSTPAAGTRTSEASKARADDEAMHARTSRYMEPRPEDIFPKPPFKRPPIFFPDIPLQILKTLSDEDFEQLRETGWVREVAFKTAPHVTKLEIRAFLESVYGMDVERVQTINYLGRRRTLVNAKSRLRHFREDDWKKAYVTFAPPPGVQLPAPPPPQEPAEMLEEIRSIAKPRLR